MLTLEERLQKRLRLWREAAKQHRQCMDELNDDDDEYWIHKIEAEVFERCIAELCIDLSARSAPSTPARAASV